MADRREIERFLEEFKMAAGVFGMQFVRPEEASQWAIDLGLPGRTAINQFVMALGVEHFVSGPEADHHSPNHRVCVFGCEVDGVEVYVKLRLTRDAKRGRDH